MISEFHVLRHQLIDLRLLPVARLPARVHQHTPYNPIRAAPVLIDLLQIRLEVGDYIRYLLERFRRQSLAQLLNEIFGEIGKIGDEVQRILDLVSDACRQRSERCEPLLNQQLVLRFLQVLESGIQFSTPLPLLLMRLRDLRARFGQTRGHDVHLAGQLR